MTPRRSTSSFQTLAALVWRLALVVGMLGGTVPAPAQATDDGQEQAPAETPLDAETAEEELDDADVLAALGARLAEAPVVHGTDRSVATWTDGVPPTPPPER